jgi:hypothetical protein
VSDAEFMAHQVQKARDFLRPLSRENSARAVEAAILNRLVERGFQAIEPDQVCAPALFYGNYPHRFSFQLFNAGPGLSSKACWRG